MDEQEKDGSRNEFKSAAHRTKSSLARDLLGLMAQNKKWWLLPLIVVLIGLGALAVLGGTAAAPFIYTLF
jgi:fluoride ion exporter CrcB/FEX